jgi:pimeloyl-ACP methyl ester carboxylesterase
MRAKKSNGLLWLVLLVGIVSVGCGAPEEQSAEGSASSGSSSGSSAAGSGETVEVGGTEAIVWGEGDRGMVLVHGAAYDAASWQDQARQLADNDVVALAVEDTSTQSVVAAANYLKEERGVRDVTLMGASAGTSGTLGAAEQDPGLADQVILISGTGDVSGLGEFPKLFVASEGEGLAETVRSMADRAPGDRNEVLILPGDAHAQAIFETNQRERLMRAILDQLEESS